MSFGTEIQEAHVRDWTEFDTESVHLVFLSLPTHTKK